MALRIVAASSAPPLADSGEGGPVIGDLWESPRTGRIYEVGEPGTAWRVVSEGDAGTTVGLLAYVGALSSFALLLNAWMSVVVGLVLGAALMYLPAVLPLTVPLAAVLFVVVAIRALVTRRRLRPIAMSAAALIALLAVAACNALFWYRGGDDAYRTIGSLPLMAAIAATLGATLIAKKRRVDGALLLAQTVVFLVPYLANVGSTSRFAESPLRYDNVLSLAAWTCGALLLAAWVAPRRGDLRAASAAL